MNQKHWSKYQLLHEVAQNPNIHIKGRHSYYSDCWDNGFEASVVRYLQGDEGSRDWQLPWQVDQLYIGDYVCIGSEAVILMGGNHTHRIDWFCLYPFIEHINEAYVGKGDTIIGDGAWIGMRAFIMPGVHIGEGAVIAANSVVVKNVAPYSIVGGNPAKQIGYRFSPEIISELLALRIYDWPEEQFNALKPHLCHSDLAALKAALLEYQNKS
ncbi:CatB-related O-acetyltransferase [Providencia stuartii]|uniref:Chloramphenicol acetyltransferase n=1 Tax=Providencia stuartii (strain MRSN 2154) TaxID=1157951 RepID=A0A140NQD3_PROSM|nr:MULTISPECIES: CatB-related O-acetyltransferase [Providencia]AFH95073.1 chloramphenicol O-acetyltransferase [Providencia stuartii MRSN 2154]MDE8745487.1 CatB-related O-acetyltransferase [Providencia thailandensis]MDE8764162.1 CatB-related O-acetyltransferase [Providencia thailandensis]MDE8776785.1 CatB-related O-acetyltransferase [Providencia thailandensis]MDE8780774.1 CatB-related O-acetyltransferase [Providencia thailandensis]